MLKEEKGPREKGGRYNLFFLVAFLAEILTPASHFSAPHRVFFSCKVFFDLWFC